MINKTHHYLIVCQNFFKNTMYIKSDNIIQYFYNVLSMYYQQCLMQGNKTCHIYLSVSCELL